MNGLILFVAFVAFLWLGRSILIPLLVAVFLWYLINAIAAYYRKVMPFQTCKHDENCLLASRSFDWVSRGLAIATLCLVTYLFATQVRPMFSELLMALPEIQDKMINLGNYLSDMSGLGFDAEMLPNMTIIATNA